MLKTCGICGEPLPPQCFYKDRSKPDGLMWRCKRCDNAKTKRWKLANPEKVKAQHSRHTRRRGEIHNILARATRRHMKLRAYAKLGGKCRMCGFSDHRALQIDHVMGTENGVPIHKLRRESTDHSRNLHKRIIRGEIPMLELQLLCANCHAIKTAEARDNMNHKKLEAVKHGKAGNLHKMRERMGNAPGEADTLFQVPESVLGQGKKTSEIIV
jgi:hypothetical protein